MADKWIVADVTSDQRFTLLISALSLLVVIMSTGLALIVRITRRWTQIEDSLKAVASNLEDIVKDKDRDHLELARRIERNESRIERHEIWHDEHPYLKG